MDTMSEATLTEWMRNQVDDAQRVRSAVREHVDNLAAIASRIASAYTRRGKVLLFGNGGSAATAEHWATELTGRFYLPDRPPLAAVALTANTAQLTAIANDFGYEEIFARLITAMAQDRDVAIGLSTSGRSANVLRGLEAAKSRKAVVVGFTGEASQAMQRWCDHLVLIPATDTARIQEGHDLCGHLVFAGVERLLFGTG